MLLPHNFGRHLWMLPQMNIDSIIEEENAEKEKLERAREEAAEKVL